MRQKDEEEQNRIFKRLVTTAFDYDNIRDISKLYFKKTDYSSKQKKKNVLSQVDKILNTPICNYLKSFWNIKDEVN